jgi:allantoinase
MRILASEPTTLMFHAEMIPPLTLSVGDDVQTSLPPLAPSGPLHAYTTFLASRPPSFETYAISSIISLASTVLPTPSPLALHIVHLSATEAIPLLRAARQSGINVTAETCFHYLSLAAEGVRAGDTRHKCCPPIRDQSNQDGLWAELENEDPCIRTVVSDHSPCTPDLKLLGEGLMAGDGKGDFFAAWGGIASVGLGLPILWTEIQRKGGRRGNVRIEDVVRWCCTNTAKQVGLDGKKGDLRVGCDADICVFDDEASFIVSTFICFVAMTWLLLSVGNVTC